MLLLSPLCGANFSLPTQRCFSFTLHSPRSVGLFSAYAEVFLYAVIRASSSVSFLCLRRGVSITGAWRAAYEDLFSAYAEVFLPRRVAVSDRGTFLCLRRGVSKQRLLRLWWICFSLPTQRCFRELMQWWADEILFSAYAEVFLDGR